MIKKREKLNFIHEFPKNEPIVSMVIFRDKIYVATSRCLYCYDGDVLTPVEFLPVTG